MRMSSLFTELRLWAPRRWTIAAGVAMAAYVALALVSGTVVVVSGSLVAPGPWWAYALPGAGAAVMGLVVASYFDAPIGAAATLCDLRWPALGFIAIYLSTDLHSVVPMLTGVVRPVVALSAIALLVWALAERLEAERVAQANDGDGEVCTTCRPLFPIARG